MSKHEDEAKEFYNEMNEVTVKGIFNMMNRQGKILLIVIFPFLLLSVGLWKVMILLLYWVELCIKDDEDVNVL